MSGSDLKAVTADSTKGMMNMRAKKTRATYPRTRLTIGPSPRSRTPAAASTISKVPGVADHLAVYPREKHDDGEQDHRDRARQPGFGVGKRLEVDEIGGSEGGLPRSTGGACIHLI